MGLIYTKTRNKKKRQNTRKRQDDRKEWEAACKRLGISSKKTKSKKKFKVLTTDANLRVLEFNLTRLPSRGKSAVLPLVNVAGRRRVYEGEMAKREEQAKKESERRKTMVAPLYNKGPAAYVAGYDPKDLGKKT